MSSKEKLEEDLHPEDHKVLKQVKETNKKIRDAIHLFSAPLQTISHFVVVVFLQIASILQTIRSYTKTLIIVGIIAVGLVVLDYQEGSHQEFFDFMKESISIYSYWVFLGILSSVGLGTGLHTFVLYLGPFIAKVTMAAYECNSTDFTTYGEDSFMCPSTAVGVLTFWAVFRKIQLEAMFWGIGTAIGELPPYFVARAAKSAGETSEELAEFEEELKKEPNNWFQSVLTKLKKTAIDLLNRLGFVGIMLFASIPNPLFDLAGIMCGHFGVSFWTFFGATMIGKAFIKAHMQASFVVLMFSKELLKTMIATIEYVLPILGKTMDDFLAAKRAEFHRSSGGNQEAPSKNIIGLLWDGLLALMLIYFLVSIVNSSVRDYLQKKHEQEEMELTEQLKKQRGKGKAKSSSKNKKKQ